MLARLVLLFTIVPLVELALLFWIAERTSWWATIGLVVVTGVVGAALARHEGLRCLQAARRKLAQGELPTDSLLDGPMILIAGTLLITPGVLTD
ncbi:MAG: FxsA family protein, partial [Pirellulales bacterium]|nr:FxsA family protein [Pirellulales bacterium]